MSSTITSNINAIRAAIETSPMDSLSWFALADAQEEEGFTENAETSREIGEGIVRKYVNPKHVEKLVRHVKRAVGTRSSKVHVRIADSFVPSDVQWSGGSRNTYHQGDFSENGSLWLIQVGGLTDFARKAIQPNNFFVEHSFFCGKDCGITIYIHPSVYADAKNFGKK